MTRRRELLAVWLGLALVGGCCLLAAHIQGGSVASAQEPAACPPNAVVRVIPPTADAPSTVGVEVEPDLEIKPAADADPESFHLHYFVDTDPTGLTPGGVIPSGNPSIIHSAETELDLKLASGQHEVWVVLGQLGHQACGTSDGNLIAGSTQFTVPAGSGANEIAASDEDEDEGNALLLTALFVLLVLAAVAVIAYLGGFGRGRSRRV